MALRFDGSIGDWVDDSMVWDPVGLRMIPKEQADAIAALPPNLRAALNNREGGIMDALAQAEFKKAGINPNLKIYGGNGQVASPGTTPDGVTADVPFGGYGFDPFGAIVKTALGTAGLQVGGASGASAANGNGVTPQTLALDAAGLAVGSGLAGLTGGGVAAAGGTSAGATGAASAAGGADMLATPDWLTTLLAETGEAGVPASVLEGGFNAAAGAGGGLFSELGLPSLGNISNVLNIAKMFGIGGGGGSDGGLSLDSLSKSPSLALRVLPGAMALGYAASQPEMDLSQLRGVGDQLAGNQNAVIQAATDPLQRNIAAGYGDLLQSQALRGIRGSSFGDTSIGNYIAQTGGALANAGANAAQGSLALQGNLAAQIAGLQNERQKLKNQLYGTAFDVLGRGLNPQGYAANIGGNANPTLPSTTPTPQPNDLDRLLALGNSAKGIWDFIGGLS